MQLGWVTPTGYTHLETPAECLAAKAFMEKAAAYHSKSAGFYAQPVFTESPEHQGLLRKHLELAGLYYQEAGYYEVAYRKILEKQRLARGLPA